MHLENRIFCAKQFAWKRRNKKLVSFKSLISNGRRARRRFGFNYRNRPLDTLSFRTRRANT